MLDTEVAAGFLVNRTGDRGRAGRAGAGRELGGLPLALEQAAAYIQATGGTLAGYLALFRHRRADLLARGQAAGHPADGGDHAGAGRFRTGAEQPRARRGCCGCWPSCAPEPIPLTAAAAARRPLAELAPGGGGHGRAAAGVIRLAAGDAIAALRRYSLVTPAADGPGPVHRLVQAVTRDQMPAEPGRPMAAGRRRPDRGRDPRRHRNCPRPGRSARRCCRTPGRPWT